LIGGPPAWAIKLVKPEVVASKAPSQRGGVALPGLGMKARRWAKNKRVKAPTIAETACACNSLNRTAPTTIPSTPKGTIWRNSALSKSLRNAAMPRTSITNSKGIKMAAASGTVTARAIIGTAKEPKPAPKPLLLMPKRSTAGTDTA
jgi:hypothetical protein